VLRLSIVTVLRFVIQVSYKHVLLLKLPIPCHVSNFISCKLYLVLRQRIDSYKYDDLYSGVSMLLYTLLLYSSNAVTAVQTALQH
jgi:hypothetical protein